MYRCVQSSCMNDTVLARTRHPLAAGVTRAHARGSHVTRSADRRYGLLSPWHQTSSVLCYNVVPQCMRQSSDRLRRGRQPWALYLAVPGSCSTYGDSESSRCIRDICHLQGGRGLVGYLAFLRFLETAYTANKSIARPDNAAIIDDAPWRRDAVFAGSTHEI
ncbi:hypothetical protein ACJJTC_011281 [Scirpophaga incertulas]